MEGHILTNIVQIEILELIFIVVRRVIFSKIVPKDKIKTYQKSDPINSSNDRRAVNKGPNVGMRPQNQKSQPQEEYSQLVVLRPQSQPG